MSETKRAPQSHRKAMISALDGLLEWVRERYSPDIGCGWFLVEHSPIPAPAVMDLLRDVTWLVTQKYGTVTGLEKMCRNATPIVAITHIAREVYTRPSLWTKMKKVVHRGHKADSTGFYREMEPRQLDAWWALFTKETGNDRYHAKV